MTTQTDNQNADKQSMMALKKHGNTILTIVLVVLAAYFGWQYYQNHYAKIDTVAADAYTNISNTNEQLIMTAQNPQLDEAAKKKLVDEENKLFAQIDDLVAKHGDTAYAWQGLMMKARHQVDNNDLKGAIASLQEASKIELDDGLTAMTKIRLARVMLADGDTGSAFATANEALPQAFEASRQELLGDIYLAKNEVDNAKKAYTSAWEALRTRQENRAVLSLKLQSLGVVVQPIEPPAAVVATVNTATTDAAQATDEATKQPADGQADTKTPQTSNQ